MPFLLSSSYTITADVTVPEDGAESMIVTSGGRFAGCRFYLLNGKPVFHGAAPACLAKKVKG